MLLALAPAPALPSPAVAATSTENDNPINDQGSSFHYRSEITGVSPRVPGLSVQVLEFADRLVLTNHTGRTVTIYGYANEPYARVLADGTAEQNTRSPATYLNTSFYGDINVPSSANAGAPPHWVVVDRTGRFEWHDHRIHYTSPATPPQVSDPGKRTLIFDWRVPLRVGAQPGAISGQLFWVPESSQASVVVIILGAAILVGGLLLVLLVRRRRSHVGRGGGGESESPPRPRKEAW